MKSPFKASKKRSRSVAPSRYSGAVTVLVVVAIWFFFAPSQVGGWASFVIVNGNSMEKGFHKGDLVITREQGSGGYEVGDVVAYLHPEIGPVIHRIIGEESDRFVLKGDNNDWLDSYQPVDDEMIGKSWIHVPAAGRLLGAMHSPLGILTLSLTMGVIAMLSFSTDKNSKNSKNSRNRRHNGGSSENLRPNWQRLVSGISGSGGQDGPPGRVSKEAEGYAMLFGAVLLASLFLAFFAFTRPATVPVSGDAGFSNTGEFSYTANVPTDIYESGRISSGEPVFRNVTDEIEMNFDYRLDSTLPTEDVQGTYSLDATVSDVNGWSRTFPIRSETTFDGGEFSATGILDLAEIQEATATLEEETGVETERYAVSIAPRVDLGGELDGQPLEDTFSPSLDFWLDDSQMQLQTPIVETAETEDATAFGTDEAVVDQLSPSESGSVASTATEANKLSIFGLGIGITLARFVALLGLVVSVLGLVRFGLPVLRARQSDDEPTRIAALHAGALVSVSENPFDEDTDIITLAAFDDLVKVAEMSEQKILHSNDGGPVHDYYLTDGDRVYRYRAISRLNDENDGDQTGDAGKPFTELVREMWR